MARPPLPPGEGATELLRLRLTAAELAEIDRCAEAAGQTRSAYVRLALAGWALLHPPPRLKRRA